MSESKAIQGPDQAGIDNLNEAFGSEPPQAVLRWLAGHGGREQVPLVSSFGADSVVLLHMISQIDPSYPILFIDTGKHFYDTLHYRDQLRDHFGLTNLQAVTPDPDDVKQKDPKGALWIFNHDGCCDLRKTLPLARVMKHYSGWITGRKRFQTSDRADLNLFELDGDKMKVNPLASWGPGDVAAYIKENSLPGHPLVPRGYLSIGCAPCTSPVEEGEDARAGRWKGSDKTECGLHI
nr:phosphoadenylyl-sulfate reductase [uncultured Cohaesibacter sp.]